jgi:hypothetical protein
VRFFALEDAPEEAAEEVEVEEAVGEAAAVAEVAEGSVLDAVEEGD